MAHMPFLFEEKESWKCDTLRHYTPRIALYFSPCVVFAFPYVVHLILRRYRCFHKELICLLVLPWVCQH